VIDRNAPLLLDDPSEKEANEDTSYLRINDACYVCHDNFKKEPLAVMHAKEEMGCADCHGESLEHQNDEDNITPPEIMYALDKVDSLCLECHDSHDVAAKDVLIRWRERCPKKTDFATVVCTDCHGYHRLKQRVVRWDKDTGDLIMPLKSGAAPAKQEK
jgi:formate-dependent nitrite reductase cytochrome c552 subunit